MVKGNPSRAEEQRGSSYVVAAIQRALGIVDHLAAQPGLSATLSQIADGVGLPRPTVHRMLANLERAGYVTQSRGNGSYRLGMRLLELGSVVAAETTPIAVAHSHLEALRDQTGETVHLAALDGRFVVYVDKVESAAAVRMVSRVGARLPAHCTALGKAMLAQRPQHDLRAMFEGVELETYTDRSAGTVDEVLRRLDEVRRLGYALDDEEVEAGLRCIGAPIWDRSGAVAGAISMSAPLSRLSDERLRGAVDAVLATAHAISSDLGYRGSRAEVGA